MYRHLNHRHIVATLDALGARIRERFPGSGLGRVSGELLDFANECGSRIDRLAVRFQRQQPEAD